MADSNRESIRYIKEVTWNVTPTTPAGQLVNFTSMGLVPNNDITESSIIKSNTNPAAPARTKKSAAGPLGYELQYGGPDDFMEAALRGAFATATDITATDISFTTSTNIINSIAGDFTNLVAGQWIVVSGSTANSGKHRILTWTDANNIVVETALTTEAATPSIRLKGTALVNSTTKQSFSIERHYEDLTTTFESYTGCRVSEMNLSLGTAAIAAGSVALTGIPQTPASSTIFTGTDVAAVTTVSMNTVGDVKGVYKDGVLLTDDITQFDINITTNSTDLDAISSDTAIEISQGSIGVSGTLNLYKDGNVYALLADSFTTIGLAVVVEDAAGNGYVFDIPSVKISGGAENGGLNGQTSDNFTFAAFENSTNTNTITITKYPA